MVPSDCDRPGTSADSTISSSPAGSGSAAYTARSSPTPPPWPNLMAMEPIGFIFTGGPNSVYLENSPQVDPALFEAGVPVLGICYGCQLMAHTLGGPGHRRQDDSAREYGKTETFYNTGCKLFKGLPECGVSWMSHGGLYGEGPRGLRP